jgi:tRNA-intron endonuclease
VSDFDIKFFVYRDLRNRGYTLKVEDGCLRGRKSFSMCFYPVSDDDVLFFDFLVSKDLPYVLAVVDGDGDITYYMVENAMPVGACSEEFRIPKVIVAGRRAFSFSNKKLSTFGKDEGKFMHFSMLECRYLGVDVPVPEHVYSVYKDLRDRALIVKSGFKYGTHFRVYERSMEEHSKYLVYVMDADESMVQVSRAIRVAHGVRKTILLARKVDDGVRYLAVSWIRP